MESIFDYSDSGIEELVCSLDQPKFRAKQLIQWLYQRGVHSYDEMTNLPKQFRAQLAQVVPLVPPVVCDKQVSADGTRKYLLEFADGCRVETVGIPSRAFNEQGEPKRLTVCFSTQVGCPMKCAFCATGQQGFTRNLTPGEMVWQILVCQDDFGMRVSNVVAMGQGEPFLNYENLVAALHFMNAKDALEIGARHISVSTCGILKGIEAFGHEKEQFTLAVSLHSAIQSVRNKLMPGCKGVPLTQLKEALLHYQQASGRRVSFEYLLIKGVTDTNENLDALIRFCEGLQSHVNLLKVNPVEGSPLEPAAQTRVQAFESSLAKAGIETSIRDSRGADIDGACGQLISSHEKRR